MFAWEKKNLTSFLNWIFPRLLIRSPGLFSWKFYNSSVLDTDGAICSACCYQHQPLRFCWMVNLGKWYIIIEAFAKGILYPQCFSFLSWMCWIPWLILLQMSTSCSLRQYNRLSTGSLSMQMSKADLLPLIDKVADNLPGWKAFSNEQGW